LVGLLARGRANLLNSRFFVSTLMAGKPAATKLCFWEAM
jgi:hypothetical protein